MRRQAHTPLPASRRGAAAVAACAAALLAAGCSAGGGNGGNGGGTASSGQAQNSGRTVNRNIGTDLQLASVKVAEFNLDDTQPEFVRFCFGHRVQGVGQNGRGFFLQGYRSQLRVRSTGAQIAEDDPSCVLATFKSGTPVSAYTIGTLQTGAVTDVKGQVAVQQSARLRGSHGVPEAGRTSAPELVAWKADRTQNQITYRFDAVNLREGGSGNPGGGSNAGATPGSKSNGQSNSGPEGVQAPNQAGQTGDGRGSGGGIGAGTFGYYTADGQAVTGKVVTVENDHVVVGFSRSGAHVAEAVRPFVAGGAIRDFQGQANVLSALGKRTTAPDLVRITPVHATRAQYDFHFDEPTKNQRARSFFVYTDGGQAVPGTAISTIDGGRTVRVTFRGVQDFGGQLVRGAVAAGAATSNDAHGATNTVGSTPIEGAKPPAGPTAGPDLLALSTDPRSGRVTYRFDEPVVQGSACIGGGANGAGNAAGGGAGATGSGANASTGATGGGANGGAGATSGGASASGGATGGTSSGTSGSAGAASGAASSVVAVAGGGLSSNAAGAPIATTGGGSGSGAASGCTSHFYVVTRGGHVVDARQIVAVQGGPVSGQQVVVLFQESELQGARLAGVDEGAVLGQAGNVSPAYTRDLKA